MKDLIKENASYKLFLVELLESFDDVYKAIEDNNFKRYIKELSISIEQILNITDRHTKIDKETLDKLFKSETKEK